MLKILVVPRVKRRVEEQKHKEQQITKANAPFFSIKYDSFGSYLAPKVGNQFHSNHPKLSKQQIIFPLHL